jgi:hypothetical protein
MGSIDIREQQPMRSVELRPQPLPMRSGEMRARFPPGMRSVEMRARLHRRSNELMERDLSDYKSDDETENMLLGRVLEHTSSKRPNNFIWLTSSTRLAKCSLCRVIKHTPLQFQARQAPESTRFLESAYRTDQLDYDPSRPQWPFGFTVP